MIETTISKVHLSPGTDSLIISLLWRGTQRCGIWWLWWWWWRWWRHWRLWWWWRWRSVENGDEWTLCRSRLFRATSSAQFGQGLPIKISAKVGIIIVDDDDDADLLRQGTTAKKIKKSWKKWKTFHCKVVITKAGQKRRKNNAIVNFYCS